MLKDGIFNKVTTYDPELPSFCSKCDRNQEKDSRLHL